VQEEAAVSAHRVAVRGRPRVRREPPARLADLGPAEKAEHNAWRRTFVDGSEDADASIDPKTLDRLIGSLHSITSALAHTYGTPDLGNKDDPVDELVYIILSRRTRENAYRAGFEVLKQRFRTWEQLAAAPIGDIESVISFSGLGRRKALSLKLALSALIERFGACTLEPTRSWDDASVQEFLCTLPEIGPKSAACVMMCSLDRPAFPVDAHVGRVLERLGLFHTVGIDLTGRDHKVKQRLLSGAVPPSLRYVLHVNAVAHGRATCLSGRPRCSHCPVARYCGYAANTAAGVGGSSRDAK
jgi:endonuclease III